MKRFFGFGFFCLLFGLGTPTDHGGLACGEDLAVAADPLSLTTTPAIQTAPWAVKWWMPRHEQKLAEKEAMAAGVAAIVEELTSRMPESKILLLAIFPRGATADDPLRVLNRSINQRIAKMANDEKIFFLDIGEIFLKSDGTLPKSVMADRLHPGPKGYRMWAEAIEPKIEQLFNE